MNDGTTERRADEIRPGDQLRRAEGVFRINRVMIATDAVEAEVFPVGVPEAEPRWLHFKPGELVRTPPATPAATRPRRAGAALPLEIACARS